MKIIIQVSEQKLFLYDKTSLLRVYPVSTAAKGVGELEGSEQTPRGMHRIHQKIGDNALLNTVFSARRPTGEIYTPELAKRYPGRDWILTRIIWLSGEEPGKNRFGDVDTLQRYIYIHGTPDENLMGTPGSHGCIRMHNAELIELFNSVEVGDPVLIHA